MLNHRPTYHDNPLHLSSGLLIAAEAQGHDLDALSFALLQAHWRDDIDLANHDHLTRACRSIGIDAAPLLDLALSDDVQATFAANTHAAKDLNVFGSPTYVLKGDMYYGQDHLDLLENALINPYPPFTFTNPSVDAP